MAQQYLRTVYPDGSVILSNLADRASGEFREFKKVVNYIDGTPMVDAKVDGGVYIKVNGEYFERALTESYINYDMFNIISGAEENADEKIALAHAYANARGLEVINLSGEYKVGSFEGVNFNVNINWGNSHFFIDEDVNTSLGYRFNIKGNNEWQNIELSVDDKASFLASYKKGQTTIPELASYPNHYFVISDENDVMYRYGFDSSKAKTDLFVVEQGGARIGEVNWELTDFTLLKAIELEPQITITGGVIVLSGTSNPDLPVANYQGGVIKISRSNTTIDGMMVKFEGEDNAQSPNRGFYYLDNVYNVCTKNIRAVPRKIGTLPNGTYGLGGENIFYWTMDNVTAYGTNAYWGVMAPNTVYNFYINRCKLNRIDVHFNAFNVYIDQTNVGAEGIRLTGAGDLFINDTVSASDGQFVRIRDDWGGRWDGKIRIRRCRGIANKTGINAILYFTYANYNYNSQIVLGQDIEVEDFEMDYTNTGNNTTDLYVFWHSPSGSATNNTNYPTVLYPSREFYKNLRVKGRNRGYTLKKGREDLGRFKTRKSGGYSAGSFTPNVEITYDDIDVKKYSETGSELAIDINTRRSAYTYDEKSLYIRFTIKNCNNLAANLGSIFAEVLVDNTEVNYINRVLAGPSEFGNGRLQFFNCNIRLMSDGNSTTVLGAFTTATKDDTTYLNCRWLAPIRRFSFLPALATLSDFNTAMGITIKPSGTTGYIYGTHVNSILTSEFRSAAIAVSGVISDELLQRCFSNNKDWFVNLRLYGGSSAIRPVATSSELIPINNIYRDTTLGKPIIWYGSEWRDFTGTVV